jgi:hypothetical protein
MILNPVFELLELPVNSRNGKEIWDKDPSDFRVIATGFGTLVATGRVVDFEDFKCLPEVGAIGMKHLSSGLGLDLVQFSDGGGSSNPWQFALPG